MAKHDRVTLTAEERSELDALISRGTSSARKLAHARVLLLTDVAQDGPALSNTAVAAAVRVSERTVSRVRQRFVEEGLAAALVPKPSSRVYGRKLDGAGEARLIALACSDPPQGRKRWSLRLLAEEMVALEVVPALSYEAVRQALGKKPAQAASAQDVVHPAPAVGRVRGADGGRARRLLPPRRSAPSARVPGRDQRSTHR